MSGCCITLYRSPASDLPRRGRALCVARSATAVKCDGYLNTRARQVLRLVLPRPSWPRRQSAPPTAMLPVIAAVLPSSELIPSTHGRPDRDRFASACSRSATFVASGALTPRRSNNSACPSEQLAREARGTGGRASAERCHSTASVRLRRRQVLAPARSAGAVNGDGFLNHRARQLQWLVLRPAHRNQRIGDDHSRT